MVRDPAKCHNAFAAWAVIYNTASSVPGALLVHYFKDRCWCLGLHSGIFLRNGWFGNRGKEVTVLEDMRDHTEQLRKEWNYEQYIG